MRAQVYNSILREEANDAASKTIPNHVLEHFLVFQSEVCSLRYHYMVSYRLCAIIIIFIYKIVFHHVEFSGSFNNK